MKVFSEFVLPNMLMMQDWKPGVFNRCWIHNLHADIQISRTVRHVLRVHDARSALFPEPHGLPRRFIFPDNVRLLGEEEEQRQGAARQSPCGL
jgi:hypothetical protein